MSEIVIYLIGITISVVMSTIIVLFFKSHLKRMLLELNGEKERPADFWVVYTNIILYLVPLIFAMAIIPDGEVESIFFQISNQFKWSLIGVVISFAFIGLAIISFVPRNKDKSKDTSGE